MSMALGSLLMGADVSALQYKISRSLRFNSADSAYLSRTPASEGNRKTWTWSGWVKRGNLSTANRSLFISNPSGTSDTTFTEIRFGTSTNLDSLAVNGYNTNFRITNQVFRDISAWYHIVVAFDTTQATASDRIKIYSNGVQITSFATSNDPTIDTDYGINQTAEHRIGRRASEYFDGYLTEINFIDGQVLTPSSFGRTDGATGVWVPKRYVGTYGTNGFYLSFKDNSSTAALGYDDAGTNDWTSNNFSVASGANNDSVVDVPTSYGTGTDTGSGGQVRGNYCIINPLEVSANTIADGGLQVTMASNDSTRGSFYVSSGKWYYEVECTTATDPYLGLASNAGAPASYTTNNAFGVNTNGDIYESNVLQTEDSIAVDAGAIYMIAFDATNKLFWFGKGGQWYSCDRAPDVTITTNDIVTGGFGYDFSGIGGTAFAPHFGNSTTAGSVYKVNFGQRPWAFPVSVPSGYKALCTANLPVPIIRNPHNYMDVALYTGTGNALSINSLNFSPDLVWLKSRSASTTHLLLDTVRGNTATLSSQSTGDEVSVNDVITSFDSNGFTLGGNRNSNTSAATYVSWCWKRGSTPGFDIVTYTGTGVARTIAHSLGAVPSMIIVKARTTASTDQGWPVYHAFNTAAPETDYLLLNSAAATADLNTVWNDTAPTASVFSVGTSALVNTNNDTYVAYLFSEIDGFSKFGSYIGNNSTDGPFVYCNFLPRFILIKDSETVNFPWKIYDTERSISNAATDPLEPNTTNSEAAATFPGLIDINSNGFKIRSANATSFLNRSTYRYIFAAFAESPFNYARAR